MPTYMDIHQIPGGVSADDVAKAHARDSLKETLKDVGVKLEETTYQLGQTLLLDDKQERFVGDEAEKANALLTRSYRAPFVVPEKV